MFDLMALSFGALKERKVRSILTILMVVIGVALMTSLNGLGGGMNSFIDEQLSSLGANVLIISSSAQQPAFGASQEMPKTKLTSQTVRTIERALGIEYAVPFISGVATLKSGGEEKSVTVIGIDQSKLKYVTPKLSLETGSLVSSTDSMGILIGHNIAYPSDLDRPLAKRGQTVSIEIAKVEREGISEKLVTKKKSFQVKGILNELGNMQVDNNVYVSLATANALFEKGGVYDGIYGITREPGENDKVEERIKKVYGENIGIISPKAIAETIKNIVGTFGSFISAIAIVSMFVGSVGIITTLYTSVMERTKEIGLLKAIGYGNSTILLMFLIESIAIGVLGGLFGLIAGIAGAYLMIRAIPFVVGITISPYFIPTDLIKVFLIAFALSGMAGFYPAWRASRLSPMTALRKE